METGLRKNKHLLPHMKFMCGSSRQLAISHFANCQLPTAYFLKHIRKLFKNTKTGNLTCVLFLVAGMIFLFSSCFLPEELPPEPKIEFEKYFLVKDTSEPILGNPAHLIWLTISFTDGDGDIGLAEGDTLPQPYYDNNLFINNIGYRIPDITPKGQNKTLKGEIDVKIWIIPASLYDTIVYEIYLVDRALNLSNIVTSPAIVLNN